jgi:hypothetical protein
VPPTTGGFGTGATAVGFGGVGVDFVALGVAALAPGVAVVAGVAPGVNAGVAAGAAVGDADPLDAGTLDAPAPLAVDVPGALEAAAVLANAPSGEAAR